MSGGYLYPTGVNKAFLDWEGDTFEWALWTAAAVARPDIHVYLDELGPGELATASYSRVPMTTPTRPITIPTAPDGTGGSIAFFCDGPDFGVLSDGEVATWLVLYNLVTTDADSPLVAMMPCGYVANGVDQALFVLPGSGAIAMGFACPWGFYA